MFPRRPPDPAAREINNPPTEVRDPFNRLEAGNGGDGDEEQLNEWGADDDDDLDTVWYSGNMESGAFLKFCFITFTLFLGGGKPLICSLANHL